VRTAFIKSKPDCNANQSLPFICLFAPFVGNNTTSVLPLVGNKIPFIRNHKLFGFTLIELMVTVVIIGILAAIAYPAYTSYGVRANRSAAQSFMLEVASREEQYLLDARSYTNTLGSGGLNLTTPDKVAAKYGDPVISVNNLATPPSYTITATPVAGSSQANDGALTLDQTGTKNPASKW
jgi:type IV pilus assembly protein PilE